MDVLERGACREAVITGLDPVIQKTPLRCSGKRQGSRKINGFLDCRVKPGNDCEYGCVRAYTHHWRRGAESGTPRPV
ncbi:MAG: hypothetical protein ACU0B1_15895 [Thermohalobaculum sp.]